MKRPFFIAPNAANWPCNSQQHIKNLSFMFYFSTPSRMYAKEKNYKKTIFKKSYGYHQFHTCQFYSIRHLKIREG